MFVVHGADAIRAAIERKLAQARLLADLLHADERFELLAEPSLSVLCLRRAWGDPEADEKHNRRLASGRY